MRSKAVEIVAKLAALSSFVKKEKLDKKRRLVKGQGPSGTAEPTQVDSVRGSPPVTPPPIQTDIVILDESSPPREVGGDSMTEPTIRVVRAEGSPAPAPLPEPAHRQRKEPVGTTSAVREEAALPQPAEAQQATGITTLEGGFRWPFSHCVSELGEQVWDEVRVMLVGDTVSGDSHREEVPEGDRFIARRPLDKESSILESGTAQIRAMEQFALPRDMEMLLEIPSVGLHLALKSYLLRQALIEHELYSRLSYA